MNTVEIRRCGKRVLLNTPCSIFDMPDKNTFYIIYFPKVKGTLTFNGAPAKILPGNFVICTDTDKLSFSISAKEKTVLYFLEFVPDDKDFLSSYNLESGVFTSYSEKETRSAFALLINEHIQRNSFHSLKVNIFFAYLMCTLSNVREKPAKASSSLCALANDIHGNFRRSSIDISPYASGENLSKDRFSVLFKNRFSLPPHRYHLALKMEEAEFLLRHSTFSVNEISSFLGFSNQLYFCSAYKKVKGEPPTVTRKAAFSD